MRKVASIAGLALASTLLISLSAVASAPGLSKPPSLTPVVVGTPVPEADARAIAAVREQWLRAVNRGEFGALLAAYAPGAVVSAAGEPPLLGADAISAFHHRWDPDAEVFYDVDAHLVRFEGDLAIEEWAAYVTVTPHDDWLGIGSDVYQYEQRGVHVYRKDARGHWRIDRETWSPDPPAVQRYAAGLARTCVHGIC
ncbi:MAG: DUF4440 domain-containing protein [Acidobacteriota bacterium]|jgi:ketosteroid isomerase-like protein